jgi:hypothetical protein
MSHFLMTVHGAGEIDEHGNYPSQEAMEQAFAATRAFNEELQSQGYWVFAGGLESASKAAVVDGEGDEPLIVDGPYLESKELLAGFWIVDVPDRDTALALAARASKACGGKVEVRAFDGLS